MLHDSTEMQSANSGKLYKTNDLVSSTDCKGKNRDGEEAIDNRNLKEKLAKLNVRILFET